MTGNRRGKGGWREVRGGEQVEGRKQRRRDVGWRDEREEREGKEGKGREGKGKERKGKE